MFAIPDVLKPDALLLFNMHTNMLKYLCTSKKTNQKKMMLWNSFIYDSSLVSITILSSRDRAENQIDRNPCAYTLFIPVKDQGQY